MSSAIAASARLGDLGEPAELVRIVHERTRPIGDSARTGLAARIDAGMGYLMAVAMPTSFKV